MTADELFRAGRLGDALAAQLDKVRGHPTDRRARFFLFELMLFRGDLARARKQLDLLRHADAEDPAQAAALTHYADALDAEAARREVMAGRARPKLLTDAPAHLTLRLAALASLAQGDPDAARRQLDEAVAAQPTLRAAVNGAAPAPGFADADGRFGPTLEVFGAGGAYCWVPLESVESLTLSPVAAPRDVILRPAHLEVRDGPSGDVLLPGLYPGSWETADEELALGRALDWVEDPLPRALGGRAFTAADRQIPLVDLHTLALEPA